MLELTASPWGIVARLPEPQPSIPSMSRNLPIDPHSEPTRAQLTRNGEVEAFPTGQEELEASRERQGATWERYWAALVRFKWIVLLMTALGAAGGLAASRFVKPQYLAEATLWVEVSERQSEDRGPIRPAELLQSYAWIELIKSYAVLDPVVHSLRLYLAPESWADAPLLAGFSIGDRFRPGKYTLRVAENGTTYSLTTSGGVEIERGKLGDSIGSDLGFNWRPAPGSIPARTTVEFVVEHPRDVARALGERLETRMAKDGNFLSIALTGPEPEQLANVLNALVERQVEVAAALKRAKLDELTAVLEEQLRYSEENLRDAEIALEAFRINTITLPSDQATPVTPGLTMTRDPVFDSFFELRVQREQLRHDREAIERITDEAGRGILSLDALHSVESVRNSTELVRALADYTEQRAELRTMGNRYTEQYDPVRRLNEAVTELERRTIPRLATALRAQLAAQEAEMARRVDGVSDELRQIPPRMIEEARLQRQVAIAENLQTTLKQRYEEARLAAASSIPDIRVLDVAATPNIPVSDNRLRIILLCLVGGLGLSVVGAIVLDHMDPRFRYPDQVLAGTGLPILTALPHVRSTSTRQSMEELAHSTEAFRELRLNLLHSLKGKGSIVLTVSSPESGDGKSFVATNLALSFADQGYATVLVDGDVRRGALHRLLGGAQTPGLTDHLRGIASRKEVVRPAQLSPLLHLVSAGTRMPNAPELVGSSRMRDFLDEVRNEFSIVIVDTPPLGAGVDPYVLGTLTGNLLLVLRTGATNRAFTEAKLALLQRLPIHVVGVVLNDVPQSSIYRYYSYLPGYHAVHDDDPIGALPGIGS